MFDPETLLRRVDGDAALARQLVALFLKTTPEVIERMRGAIRARDRKHLETCAHILNNSVGVLGVEPLFDAVIRLEDLAKKEAWGPIEAEFAEIDRLSAMLRPELETFK